MSNADHMISSARNQFKGVITRITEGAVNSEIIMDIGGQQIAATIAKQSVKELDLKAGSAAMAL
ncbi:MAG: TOBE domain-containing protein, partial [Syntrophobacterales bacterium]|nr:TOBE domain-containing protein [Syntrophobacterales bacterium]